MSRGRRRRKVSSKWLWCWVIFCASIIGVYLWGIEMIFVRVDDVAGTDQASLAVESESNNNNIAAIDFEAERRKSYEYAQSITDTRRRLMFLHVPKAAGTTIEDVGSAQAGMRTWGSCGFVHLPRRRKVCKYPKNQFTWPTMIGWWHLPAQIFPLLGVNPYENAEIFVAVREPRERLLSEFYYVCQIANTKYHIGRCDQTRTLEAEYMNEWIQARMREELVGSVRNNVTGSTAHSFKNAETYLRENGHFTPQSEFVISKYHNIRMADYVLHMDRHLPDEFKSLMDAYDLPARLSEHTNAAKPKGGKHLTVSDFDNVTNALIDEVYGQDFDLFR